MSVGILGIAAYLPDEIRENSWWPTVEVEKWERAAVDRAERTRDAISRTAEHAERLVLEAMLDASADPFRGVRQRRVMPREMKSSDMEFAAAKMAIERAGITPREVDAVLCYSMCPDDLTIPNGIVLHDRLGLREDCYATSLDVTCNAFLMQLDLARAMIISGRARHVLLVQSCGISRLLRPEDPSSPWFGDGAGAAVVGPKEGAEVLSITTFTDSSLRCAVVTGVPGREWYDEGRTWFYARDRVAAHRILMGTAKQGKQAVESALAAAGTSPDDVEFFACHQAQIWMRRVIQDHVPLNNARFLDTFAWAGNIGGANLPLVLECASREGLLRKGNLTACFGGGAGVTWSGALIRWG